jgi:hypothetical protein
VPFQNYLTIETMPLTAESEFEVEIINQLGQTVTRDKQQAASGGTQRMYVDMSSQPKGMYIIRYKQGNKISFKNIIKN